MRTQTAGESCVALVVAYCALTGCRAAYSMRTLTLPDQTVRVKTIYEADFTHRQDEWIVEGAPIRFENGRLYCDARGKGKRQSTTVWCTRPFEGNTVIEYTGRVEKGPGNTNLNFFVYASELGGHSVIQTTKSRTGAYKEYHGINNYIYTYLNATPEGSSGSSEQTRIRFRRNPGFKLLKEQWRPPLIKGREYHFTIVVQDARMRFYVDDKLITDHGDFRKLHRKGHHGYRTWNTHFSSGAFRVSRVLSVSPPQRGIYVQHRDKTPRLRGRQRQKVTRQPIATPRDQSAKAGGDVRTHRSTAHPRILFTKNDIPALKAKLKTPTGRLLWNTIKNVADAGLKAPVPEWGKVRKLKPASFPWTTIKEPRPALMYLEHTSDRLWGYAFAYAMTGEKKYAELTKRFLVAIGGWPDWSDNEHSPEGLGFAHMLGAYAFAYDCVAETMNDRERRLCATALHREAERNYHAAAKAWWGWAAIQNHSWWHSGSQVLAGLALEGEDPAAEKWLKDALEGVRVIHEATRGITDGSWPEGPGYQSYAQRAFSAAFYALSKNKRFDPWDENEYFKNFARWCTYNWVPRTNQFLMGYSDTTGLGGPGATYLQLYAWRFRDGRATWLAQKLLKGGGTLAEKSVKAFIFFDPKVQPKAPDDLPLAVHLKDLEGVVFRSSWDRDALLFGLKCGPYGGRSNFDLKIKGELPYSTQKRKARGDRVIKSEYSLGHSHQDAGTFWINWKGVFLTREVSGYSRNADLHNIVLVNGRGQLTNSERATRLSHWKKTGAGTPIMISQKGFDYCVANVGPRYMDNSTGKNPLKEFTRHVVFVHGQPGYFVLVDRLIAQKPSTFEWICHFNKGAEREGNWIKGKADATFRLGVQVLAPRDFSFRTGKHTRGRKNTPEYVKVSNMAPQKELRFITLLWPGTESTWNNKPSAAIEREDGRSLSLKVRVNGRTDRIQITYGVNGKATVSPAQ